MGQFELRSAVKALPLMAEKLRRRNFQRGSAQLAHTVNRMFTTLESKGILRTAPEEFMLTSLHKAHDPLAAEFFRTCRHELFFGKQYLTLYEALKNNAPTRESSVTISKKTSRKTETDAQSLYGFRPDHADTFYMSTWEFCQWFERLRLQIPSAHFPYSMWTDSGIAKREDESLEPMIAGEDYVFNFAKIAKMTGVYAFPEGKNAFIGHVPASYEAFRASWILVRRLRPKVPCPENTPFRIGGSARRLVRSSCRSI